MTRAHRLPLVAWVLLTQRPWDRIQGPCFQRLELKALSGSDLGASASITPPRPRNGSTAEIDAKEWEQERRSHDGREKSDSQQPTRNGVTERMQERTG